MKRALCVGALCAGLFATTIARAETVSHDLLGVSLRVPDGFTADQMVGRSRSGILWAWSGGGDRTFKLIIVERRDGAPATRTADDAQARKILDEGLSSAHTTSVERASAVWRNQPIGVLIGHVAGHEEGDRPGLSFVFDVPTAPITLRMRVSGAESDRAGVERVVAALLKGLRGRPAASAKTR